MSPRRQPWSDWDTPGMRRWRWAWEDRNRVDIAAAFQPFGHAAEGYVPEPPVAGRRLAAIAQSAPADGDDLVWRAHERTAAAEAPGDFAWYADHGTLPPRHRPRHRTGVCDKRHT